MTLENPRDDYTDEKSDDDILAEAKAFYKDDVDFESEQVKEMAFDMAFENNDNVWDDGDWTNRQVDDRPSLKIPRINQFLNQVKNEQRQTKPVIKVSPRGAETTDIQKKREKAAKNRQGLIRYIQYDSKAVEAYQTAFDHAVGPGRGFYRLVTEYEDPKSFNQSIKIERIKNPLLVVMDRFRKELDYSDCRHGFIIEKIPLETFKMDYPEAEPISWSSQSSEYVWADDGYVWLVEYYCIRYRQDKLVMLDDGTKFYMSEIKELESEEDRQEILDRVVRERDTEVPYVMWYLLTEKEVLRKERIAGTYIPIFPVIGIEKDVEGRITIKGLTRDLVDPQKNYNFWSSIETELLSLAPKTPFIGAEGQFEDHEDEWGAANNTPFAYLEYKAQTHQGHLLPPPQRQPFAGIPTGILQAKLNIIEDMKAITGIYDPGLGNIDSNRSGRAILALEAQGNTATFHFPYNLGMSLNHCGRVINQWLDVYYDTDRIEKILGEDGTEQTIELGGFDEDGDQISLGDGDFDVVITMGPEFKSKRQEAAEAMLEFLRVAPNTAPLIQDLLVKNMDWPGADEIAERLRKLVPPEILSQEGGEERLEAQLRQAISQLEQDQQLIQVLSAKLDETMKELEDKGAEIRKDLAVEQLKSDTQLVVANIKANVETEKNRVDFRKEILRLNNPSKPVQ